MNKLKVMVIFGTRPEAIKFAPLIRELQKNSDKIETIVTVTAQHREMLDQVLETFAIVPDYDLNIMKNNQSLTDTTVNAIKGLDVVIKSEQPNLILVHGDTTTTFAASLAAFYNKVSIGHVESGLRSWEKHSPYPEEVNRQLTSIIADLHFAPTKKAAENLIAENKNKDSIFVTGNTAIDTLKLTVSNEYNHPLFSKIGTDKLILLTTHRRENFGGPMQNIFKAIKRIVSENKNVQVVYPVHLNPHVKKTAYEILGCISKVHLIDPLGVRDFHNFMNKSYIVLTDSGGLQEEAPSLGVPVLVLRSTTERPEGIEAGALKLVGTEQNSIYTTTQKLLNDKKSYTSMVQTLNPYGDGKASERIVKAIKFHHRLTDEKPADFNPSLIYRS
ncbi:MAG: UDP-N-acetylglucosamine 2-epimerase [Bacillales bacterium]|jgi:UDP-N-acetylglucosamine 2-epimerase (non-hydrolysing)|nr:UDP-N-acetylglucosamine 2-epimerase [Bacillales bacterium]